MTIAAECFEFMLSVTFFKSVMLSVAMLSFVMLDVVMLSFIVLNVMAPLVHVVKFLYSLFTQLADKIS
jgi:hypothetical protein